MMRWRFALGVCMASAALLVGSAGGAIAAADPDPVDSTAESQGVDGSTQGVDSATGPVEGAEPKRAHPIRSAIRAKRESASPTGPMTMGATTGTQGARPDGHQRVCHGGRRTAQRRFRIQHGGYQPRSPRIRT